MRTILLAALLCPLLCAGPGAKAQPAAAPEPTPSPFSPASPSEPEAPPPAFDENRADAPNTPAASDAPVAPAPPPNPNSVTVRRPAILHWWEDPIFDRRVTLVVKDADLNTAIDALGKAANMNLISAGGSKARKKVTLNLRSAPLRDVMLAIANLYGLTWFRAGEVYTLTYVSTSTRRTGGTTVPALPRPRRPVIVVPERSSRGATTGATKPRSRPATAPVPNGINKSYPDSPAPGQ